MAGADLYTTARFWSKIRVGGASDCWPWQGGTTEKGYGRFKVDGELVSPHRFAWELANGPIPDNGEYHGTVIIHRCDNPACCNPFHLRAGTQRENVKDMDAKGRRGIRDTKNMHKLTEEQTARIIADPRPHRVIAGLYGVSKTHVGAIKRGEVRGYLQVPIVPPETTPTVAARQIGGAA